MRIAFLDTNTDDTALAARHPAEVEKFRTLLGPHAAGWTFADFAVHRDRFPDGLSGFDGVMISGSPASVNDPAPWVGRLLALIRDAVAAEVPVFGACFGHQAVAKALGGTVAKNPGGWQLGRVESAPHSPAGWMAGAGPVVALHAAHKEQVTAMPPGARALGGTGAVPVGHMALGGRVFTTQYHPELDAAFMRELIAAMADDLDPAERDAAAASLGARTDEGAMAAWIARFFAEARA